MRWIIVLTAVLVSQLNLIAQTNTSNSNKTLHITGWVLDKESKNEIAHATIKWSNTNIIVFTNNDGKFTIKSENITDSSSLEITSLGYQKNIIPLKSLTSNENKIYLTALPINLAQINIFPTDPLKLLKSVLANRENTLISEPIAATAFYRETVKKGWSYASISEAVLQVNKQPYFNQKGEQIQLIQGRKSTDYTKLDTISFKLEGGPHSAIRMDILREPYLLFDAEDIEKYDFKMGSVLPNDNNINYVIEFKQKESITEPLYYGKLYIDPTRLVLTKAEFSLNLKNIAEATKLFLKQKPMGAKVTPTLATYTVTYSEKDGKWFYAYSKGEVNFKVKWDKKLFKSNYLTTIEMAITNWQKGETKNISSQSKLKPNVIMNQAVAGFGDVNFWGEYNILEPEIPIEKAIEKIRKNIE